MTNLWRAAFLNAVRCRKNLQSECSLSEIASQGWNEMKINYIFFSKITAIEKIKFIKYIFQRYYFSTNCPTRIQLFLLIGSFRAHSSTFEVKKDVRV